MRQQDRSNMLRIPVSVHSNAHNLTISANQTNRTFSSHDLPLYACVYMYYTHIRVCMQLYALLAAGPMLTSELTIGLHVPDGSLLGYNTQRKYYDRLQIHVAFLLTEN